MVISIETNFRNFKCLQMRFDTWAEVLSFPLLFWRRASRHGPKVNLLDACASDIYRNVQWFRGGLVLGAHRLITQVKAQGPSRTCNESKEERRIRRCPLSSLIVCTSCIVKSFRSRGSFISSPLSLQPDVTRSIKILSPLVTVRP